MKWAKQRPGTAQGGGCVLSCLFFMQTGSRQVAHLVGLFCVGLGLSPRLAQLFINIPLPVLGKWIDAKTGIRILFGPASWLSCALSF